MDLGIGVCWAIHHALLLSWVFFLSLFLTLSFPLLLLLSCFISNFLTSLQPLKCSYLNPWAFNFFSWFSSISHHRGAEKRYCHLGLSHSTIILYFLVHHVTWLQLHRDMVNSLIYKYALKFDLLFTLLETSNSNCFMFSCYTYYQNASINLVFNLTVALFQLCLNR